MRKSIVVLVLVMVSIAGVWAHPHSKHPASSEFAISGTYIHPKDADAEWQVDGQIAFPFTTNGVFVWGPKVRFSSDDSVTAGGMVLELNFLGSSHTGPYVGANGLYNLKNVHGPNDERYTVDAVAGFKFQLGEAGCIGGCGGFKAYASKTVAGRDSFDSDITGNLGLFVRF